MDTGTSRVIGTAALVTVGVGTLNSFFKNKRPPSLKFLMGSGAVYVILSGIGEAEPELAKALAAAVAVTVVLGEGNGVLGYISPKGEISTQPKSDEDESGPLGSSADLYPSESGPFVPDYPAGLEDEFQEHGDFGPASSNSWPSAPYRKFVPDTISPFPGLIGNN